VLRARCRRADRAERYLALAAACPPWVVVALARMAFLEAMAGLLIPGMTGAQHPLAGIGLGSTRTILMSSVTGGKNDVHNEYLRLSAATGLIGAGLHASGAAAWLMRVVRLVRSGHRLVRELAFPAVAGVVVLAVDCFAANTFDYYTQIAQYLFFLLAGAMAATSLAEGEGAPSSRQAERS